MEALYRCFNGAREGIRASRCCRNRWCGRTVTVDIQTPFKPFTVTMQLTVKELTMIIHARIEDRKHREFTLNQRDNGTILPLN